MSLENTHLDQRRMSQRCPQLNLVFCFISTLDISVSVSQSQSVGINPLYIMVPCTLSASFAFMLPVATPPNAIVFSYGYLKVSDMVSSIIWQPILFQTEKSLFWCSQPKWQFQPISIFKVCLKTHHNTEEPVYKISCQTSIIYM